MMFTYRIGYWTCEESEYDYLTHETQFTEEELDKMVHDSVVKAIGIEKKQEHPYVHSYENIHTRTINLLCSDYGFEPTKIEGNWTVFGWASMFLPNDWDMYRNEPDKLTSLTKRLLKEGFSVKDDDHLSRSSKPKARDNAEI